ncbi:hypothetical protein CAter282_1624 [Collimonas arenae]|uniref:Uncharacterized protein n=1 Tax=Collimonas arenae TaxID=279058 RepID=A0A127QHD0_9BURK|nr:hypothetical protein CAter10_1752 [Collimonas arenae]AMP09406.1 hypothetical protein CAter282_1624 [Collimonas arenae]
MHDAADARRRTSHTRRTKNRTKKAQACAETAIDVAMRSLYSLKFPKIADRIHRKTHLQM